MVEKIKKMIDPDLDKVHIEESNTIGVQQLCASNVVSENTLHNVQGKTLNYLKNCLEKTYGPMGSYTIILRGDNPQTIAAEYSKDGMKVLKNIIFDSPIEMSIQSEILEITRYVESKVGDGTTSAVILSSLVYNGLRNIMDQSNIPPRIITDRLKSVIEVAKQYISLRSKPITVEDIYAISMISTNGNDSISTKLANVYGKYGFDVNIDVTISNDTDTKIKIYDGLTIEEGYSDPAYINNPITGTSDIHNAHIYAFQDPIDTPEMVSYMERIIVDNVLEPLAENDMDITTVTPTVIVAPKITRDASAIMTQLVSTLYEFDKAKMQRPPVLVVTNLAGMDEQIYLDIARLCGCKYIKKYIDPEIQKKDQESGVAPTLDTIHEFAGSAELVSADMSKTKFINPKDMVNGSGAYDTLVQFLKAEIDNATKNNDDELSISRLKKRLKCLEANMIDFMVGGISVSDRDSLRDLVEDAVKNCHSAAENGVGRAANFEGLNAFCCIVDEMHDGLDKDIAIVLLNAYFEAATILYGTVVNGDKAKELVFESISHGCPYNVMDIYDNPDYQVEDYPSGMNVLCSINTDIEILDAIAKIVSIMVTSNQCLLQSTVINRYRQ